MRIFWSILLTSLRITELLLILKHLNGNDADKACMYRVTEEAHNDEIYNDLGRDKGSGSARMVICSNITIAFISAPNPKVQVKRTEANYKYSFIIFKNQTTQQDKACFH